jgi:hypothetical protein
MRPTRLVLLSLVTLIALGSVAAANPCPNAKPGRYAVKIDSAPQGAVVYIGDKTCQVGATPWTGKLNKAAYTVIIEAPGYEPATRTFNVAALRKAQELFVPLVKRPDPPRIDIRADADPRGVAGAQVWLDGEMKGVAPLTLTTTPGRHQLLLKKDGYETFEQWITATDNQMQTLMPTLKEIAKPKFGSIVVEADVPDAEVYIDGNRHPDNTPAVVSNVIEGLHVVEVRKPPALPWKQTVQVSADKPTKVRAELSATMAGGVGVVRVLSDAPGARAFIDGTDMGPVPVDIKDVKAGDHIIQVKAPGMQTGEKVVKVAAGGTQIVKFDLNAETPADQGTIKVVSMVPEALVFIGGEAAGKVPVEKKISAGEHLVLVRLEGHKQFEQKVRVEAGQTATVTATLKPVGRLRVLSNPAQATVIINGLPAGKTPLDQEVEVGETVIRLELAGFQSFEQTLQIEGGKTQTLSRELALAGLSEDELTAQQRGLSSWGARTLPTGRSTVDFSAGYPYFFNVRVNVGAGKIADRFGFDAGVGLRTLLARQELGIGARAMLADSGPFSAGIFTDMWWGSKLLDDSGRNGLTWDIGASASLTALSHVTITGRMYLNIWTDRHCPTEAPTMTSTDGFEGTPLGVCRNYRDGRLSGEAQAKIEKVTGWQNPSDVYNRENGIRLMTALIAEIAVHQRWNVFGIFEIAPLQDERALFTDPFAHPMFETDYNLYIRLGTSYKF